MVWKSLCWKCQMKNKIYYICFQNNNMSIITNQIEKRVLDVLEQVRVQLWENNITDRQTWTGFIKSHLTEIAYEEYQYRVHASSNEVDPAIEEWLFDLVWYSPINNENIYDKKAIHLILESEWNGQIEFLKYDFYKLLIGRAENRVFIFESQNVQNTMDILQDIVNQSSITQKGDSYLLAGWANTEEDFETRLIIKE